MRAALSVLLALHVVLTAVAPHVHLEPSGSPHEPCAVCVVRTADVARAVAPDLALARVATGEVALAPVPVPSTGAPLGAIPGQSPPA